MKPIVFADFHFFAHKMKCKFIRLLLSFETEITRSLRQPLLCILVKQNGTDRKKNVFISARPGPVCYDWA